MEKASEQATTYHIPSYITDAAEFFRAVAEFLYRLQSY